MNDNELKNTRKIIFNQIKIAKEKLESATLISERETNVDAIPILFKAVDIIIRTLLTLKKKSLGNYHQNINSLEEEFKEEELFDKESIDLFRSLSKMNESYMNEIEIETDENTVKKILDKTEDFLDKTYKYLKTQLATPKEIVIKKRIRKIVIASSAALALAVIIFFLVKLGMNIFGPQHGLSAYYYDNIQLKGQPAVEKIDKKINFMWGSSSPQKNITGDFSVRWEGRIKIDTDDKYTFYIVSDEGVRLFIDDKIIINTWTTKNRMMENSGTIQLKKGLHKIKLEYFFNQKQADIKLLWRSSAFKKRTVGSKVLFPPPLKSSTE